MTVEDDVLAGTHCVVDFAERGILDVAPKRLLTLEIDFSAIAKVPGPGEHRTRHHELTSVVGVRRHGLQCIFGEVRLHLYLFH
eukprot:CAMPEP_0180667540 /NCGR_PEP_ID=MMETSP1037_2-20121125/62435_1 /TAXON_ID=632150 /ORGANISM="Azadinium spinosum, Strain 3D9" /LENGTH=82 /DNA_ID=CAMNT_0022696187 /DNA_START=116 /DNA_END=364 /DNA_ORIENTATION=+